MPHILPSPPARPPRAARVRPLIAAMLTATAAWLSQAIVAFTGTDAGRIALVPLSVGAIAASSVVGAAVWWLMRRGASAAPLWLLVLIALPWVPAPLPPALLLWTGPMALLIWLAVGVCMLVTPAAGIRQPSAGRRSRRPPPRRCSAACHSGRCLRRCPRGDEPHYLVITQSLLKDGDIRIENNHRQRDYRTYFGGDIAPHYRVRGRNGEIYSIHAPGLPAFVAPAFAIAGYRGVVLFLVILAAVTAGLAWHLAWLITGRTDAAWFGWASVVFSATFLFHAFTVYPDGPAALVAYDRRLGVVADRPGSRAPRRVSHPLAASRGGAGRAPVDAHAICRPCRWSRLADPAPARKNAQCAEQGGRFPRGARCQRRVLDRLFRQNLRHAGPLGAIRRRAWIVRVRA